MTIEVRQLLVTSQIAAEPAPQARADAVSPELLARLKEEILAECKAWMNEKLQDIRER